jgi:hypothetical protein
MSEPVRVIPLDYAPPPTVARRFWSRVTRPLLIVSWLVCLGASLLVVTEGAETVLVTGPVIFGLGITMMMGGIRLRYQGSTILGGCHVAVCLLFFGLVVIRGWGPGDATKPFGVMGTIYCAATLAPSIVVWRRPPQL